MKKKTEVTKTRVNKAAVLLEEYKALAQAYCRSVRDRKSVEHSRTPATTTRDGKTSPTGILISELTSIVKTAYKLDKFVVLGFNGDSLVVLLEDKVPPPSFQLFY